MRIAFVLPTIGVGGGSRVIALYSQLLLRRGHTVCIVSPPPAATPLRRKLKSWIKGRCWPAEGTQTPSLQDDGLDHRILDRWRPVTDDDVPESDVVVATWWETAEWVNALSPAKGAKAYFIQGHEVFPYLPIERCHATYRLPLHKIVVSRWLQQIMSTLYGDHVVDLVPNSIDRTRFFAPIRGKQEVPTAGFVYSVGPIKGCDLTISALESVRRQIADLHVISFGFVRPTSDLPLPKNSEFFFSPSQHFIRELYARCDVWITGSRSDGFNLPALEAMACRTPIVATRVGWPAEAVRSEWNGVLVDIEDCVGLARGAEWVLSRSDAEWRELSANAFATAASGSWEESTEMFEKALQHACLRARRGEIAGSCTSDHCKI